MTKKHLIQLADILVNMVKNEKELELSYDNHFVEGYKRAVEDIESMILSFSQSNAANFDKSKWSTYITKKVSK